MPAPSLPDTSTLWPPITFTPPSSESSASGRPSCLASLPLRAGCGRPFSMRAAATLPLLPPLPPRPLRPPRPPVSFLTRTIWQLHSIS